MIVWMKEGVSRLSDGADDKALLFEMPVEAESSCDFSAMHAIEAGEVDDAEVAELRDSPLGECALKAIFAHDGDRCHGKNAVVEIHQRRRSQSPLNQGT